MAIEGARIQRVTQEGLFYLDENGKEVFIDLEAIHQRKIAKFLEPKSLRQFQARTAYDDDELEQAVEARKVIKDIGEWIPYEGGGTMFIFFTCHIEFDTEPPTRFELDCVSKHTDTILAKLQQHGWVLYGPRRSGEIKPPRW